MKLNTRRVEKEVALQNADKYTFLWNDLSRSTKPENIRKAMNQSFNEIAENKRILQKELLMNTEETQENPGDYKHFLKLQVEMKDLQKLKASRVKEEAAKQMTEHQKYFNDFEVLERQREKQIKDNYAQQLSQQITERNLQKEKKMQYDEIDKEINKTYIKSLLKNKGDEINPIFFGGMPGLKYKEVRRKFEKRSNDSQFTIADNSSPEQLKVDTKRSGINKSALDNRVNLNRSIIHDVSNTDKQDISKKYESGRNLIINTGSNIIEGSSLNPTNMMNNYSTNLTVNHKKSDSINSFRRLGFDSEYENNPNVNAHLGYNIRNANRQSSIDYKSDHNSSQTNRNVNRTLILEDKYGGQNGSILYPKIDRDIIRNNKMDHIDSYIFNTK